MEIAWRPLGELIPYARNPRTHSDAQVAQIAASIREFGWTNPVLVDGANGIIAGHGRVLAARKLGLDRVPVIELAHMSEAQKRAYVLADNQLALNAGWDEALLRLELADLSELGFDLGLIGFGEGELERLLAGDGKDGPDRGRRSAGAAGAGGHAAGRSVGAGRAPAAVRRRDRAGRRRAGAGRPARRHDLHRSALQRRLRQLGRRTSCAASKRQILNDDLGSGFEAFLHDACANILSVTKGAVYVCMSSSELHTLQRAFTAAGGKWSTFVIWAKHTFTLGRADYQRQYEPILYGWPRGSRSLLVRRAGSGRRLVRGQAGAERPPSDHEAGRAGRAGDPELEQEPRHRAGPFGGSGSTLIACEKAGRQARLVELDPKYCDVIVQRWQEWTGEQATLEGDGRASKRSPPGARPRLCPRWWGSGRSGPAGATVDPDQDLGCGGCPSPC